MANLVKIQFTDNTIFFVSPNAPVRWRNATPHGWGYGAITDLSPELAFQVWNGEDWVPAKLPQGKKKVKRTFELVVEFEVPADEDDARDTIISVEQDVVAMLGTIAEDGTNDAGAMTIVSIDSGPAD